MGLKRFRTVKREDVDAERVLGGPMGVYEAERHPFLGEELALITERLALRRPVFGICLEAQLLASAGRCRGLRGVYSTPSFGQMSVRGQASHLGLRAVQV